VTRRTHASETVAALCAMSFKLTLPPRLTII
jgi:hypothetical protein